MLDKLARNKWLWAIVLLFNVFFLRQDLDKGATLDVAIDGFMLLLAVLCLAVTTLGRKEDA